MNRHIILQQATGEPYESMLLMTKDWHGNYCDRHKWEYSPRLKEGCNTGPFWAQSMGEIWLRNQMDRYPDGTVLWYLPADALVCKPEIDGRMAIPDGADLAAFGSPNKFVNSSPCFVRNSQKVRDFYDGVISAGAVDGNVDISYGFSKELWRSDLKVNVLSSVWNWYETYGDAAVPVNCAEEDAVIRCWHGMQKFRAYKMMALEIGYLKECARA